MRKLITSLSFAAFAAAGIIGLTGPSLAGDGGLRIVHEYPNPTIDDSNFPVFASEEAWFKKGSTAARATTVDSRNSGSQVAGDVDHDSEKSRTSRAPDCLGNLDGDGEPKGPLHPGCY